MKFSRAILDVLYILFHIWSFVRLMQGKSLAPLVREAIMLVISGINRCPACIRYHRKSARAAGLSSKEINSLLAGRFDSIDDAMNAVAVYAAGAAKAPVKPAGLSADYSKKEIEAIVLTTAIIRTGNYFGKKFFS